MNDMGQKNASRADLHCHSTASQISKLGVQRALGLPECATPPEEAYELAKRRGMDFVTLTDHDTIAGAIEIAENHADAFVSEELTTWFRGEPQAVHVLCFGITPDDHAWLQANASDVEAVAEYLHGNGIACSLAHPFYAVEAPLEARHRRRLAEIFPCWETRNGSRAKELNLPAAIYADTHGGTASGGSDDHAGVEIGRTWTETPPTATWQEFLDHIRGGRTAAAGAQGSAAKWAHSAMALAVRALGEAKPVARPPAETLGEETAPPNPATVLRMVERVMTEGDARRGAIGADLGPDDARALLRAWLAAVDLDLADGDLIAYMQADDFSHSGLFRRACRTHERKLAAAVERIVAATADGRAPDRTGLAIAAFDLFDACVAAVPYAPAAAFLGREKAKLTPHDHEPFRVALVADGVGGMHGVTRTIEEIRARGVPGFEVEVIGTDPNVDRRLAAVAEVDIPFYEGLEIGVPSLPAVVQAIAEGRYDLVHLCSPGPAGVAAAMVARVMEIPILGSYHTELAAYAGLRTGDGGLEAAMAAALGAFYSQAGHVLSPSESADETLVALGLAADRIGRWDRGVDTGRFHPGRRDPLRFSPPPGEPPRVNVLYAGRLTKEKGADLLADAFLAARLREPRLHLLLAGGGPEEGELRARLGDAATFLGWQEGEELATTFASADLFLFCSQTDTFGQVILEGQASGLPVVAVAAGGPVELIEDGVSGCLTPPEPGAVAEVVVSLAGSRAARARLARGGLAAVAGRTWQASMERLALGYGTVLDGATAVQAGEIRAA